MRAGVALAAIVSLLSFASASVAAKDVTYWLHATGECSGEGEITYFADQEDSDGDLDGCGAVGAAGAAGGFSLSYPADNATNALISQGHAATARIFVATGQPDQVSVDAVFQAGQAACGGSSETQQSTNVFGVNIEYVEFAVACTFSADAPSTVKPSVTITVHASANYFIGYEEDHASRFELGELAAPAPTNQTNNETQPPSDDTPAPASVVVLASLGLAVVVARRRRA